MTEKTVHPRVCGEHSAGTRLEWIRAGSSPRVRGTLAARRTHAERFRFIPACAGNTGDDCREHRITAVHPRVCGEHNWQATDEDGGIGSSPRVRGTLAIHCFPSRPLRFIPACAGNTASKARRTSPRPAHPRVCGEHYRGRIQLAIVGGSSPRVRGTHTRHGDKRHNPRFIPACAGNTSSSASSASP